jgi:DNA recombination protein RmuC
MPDVVLLILVGIVGLLAGGAGMALLNASRITRLSADCARLEAELAAANRTADDQRAALGITQAQLREAFASLSQDALRENRQDFLQYADALLAPVRDTLHRVQGQLADVDKARESAYSAVATQLSELSTAQRELRDAAEGLTRSLRSPNVRGKWGELQLRRIVELAGMASYCDFEEKPTSETDDGSRLTPDLVVHLPGEAVIVVDAKVPIDAYLAAGEARTDAERETRMVSHVRQVREHIRTLGAKEYWRQFKSSPEFVVMFLPLEPLLASALEREPALLDQAAGLRVIPATPLTLLALLKAAALGWRQERIARNAEEIQLIGRELYERLATMIGHLELVGKNLKQAGDAYDRFVGSLEQKVLPGARRFRELGVHGAEELEPVEPVRLSLRAVTRSELTGRPDPADDEVDPRPRTFDELLK